MFPGFGAVQVSARFSGIKRNVCRKTVYKSLKNWLFRRVTSWAVSKDSSGGKFSLEKRYISWMVWVDMVRWVEEWMKRTYLLTVMLFHVSWHAFQYMTKTGNKLKNHCCMLWTVSWTWEPDHCINFYIYISYFRNGELCSAIVWKRCVKINFCFLQTVIWNDMRVNKWFFIFAWTIALKCISNNFCAYLSNIMHSLA